MIMATDVYNVAIFVCITNPRLYNKQVYQSQSVYVYMRYSITHVLLSPFCRIIEPINDNINKEQQYRFQCLKCIL